MLIVKNDEKKNTPSPHHMKKNRVIRVILNAHFKHGLVVELIHVVVVVAFDLIVQDLVELCEQHQQMNIQEDWVEIELEQDVLIQFQVEDNHKHEFELEPIV
jgi:hypothetical protein